MLTRIRKICLDNLSQSYYERVLERGEQVVYYDAEEKLHI
jgi:hypothetical protein